MAANRNDKSPSRRELAYLVVALLIGCSSTSPPDVVPAAAGGDAVRIEPAHAGIDTSAPVAEKRAAPRKQPFLWRVAGENGAAYLCGTLPLGVSATRDLAPSVWRALEESSTFVLQTDVRAVDEPTMGRLAIYPQDESLRDHLTGRDWKTLAAKLKPIHDEGVLERLRPWYVYLNLLALLQPTKVPMDVELLRTATRRRKDIVELESWRERVDLVRQVFGVEDLTATLRDIDAKAAHLEGQAEAYRRGDLDGLATLLLDAEETRRNPRIVAEFIEGRSEKWLPKIAESLARGDVFIAVGVAHLAGERGLIARLSERGLVLTRLED